MEKAMVELEISMTKFLTCFLGITPSMAKGISHDDASHLFSNLVSFSDRDFFTKSLDLNDFVRVKDKNKVVRYYKKPDLVMDNCSQIEEYSLKIFLARYFGINPSISRLLTHDEAIKNYGQINFLTESEFEALNDSWKNIDYVKVSDVNNDILYYDKVSIYNNENDIYLDDLVLKYNQLELDDLDKWELLELRRKLKLIRRNNKQVLNQQLSDVSRQLSKRKRDDYL